MKTLVERFHTGYLKTDSCWNWQRSKDKDGYGYIKKDGKTSKAHRVSYELAFGPIIDNLWVLHKCDNPSCVNPEHLFLGTSLDNNHDMVDKGRAFYPGSFQKGSSNSNARLSEEDVKWIRENYKWGKGPEFAKKFEVGVEAIRRIIQGRSWEVLIEAETARYKDLQ